jgi:hypothetical protein
MIVLGLEVIILAKQALASFVTHLVGSARDDHISQRRCGIVEHEFLKFLLR